MREPSEISNNINLAHLAGHINQIAKAREANNVQGILISKVVRAESSNASRLLVALQLQKELPDVEKQYLESHLQKKSV